MNTVAYQRGYSDYQLDAKNANCNTYRSVEWHDYEKGFQDAQFFNDDFEGEY